MSTETHNSPKLRQQFSLLENTYLLAAAEFFSRGEDVGDIRGGAIFKEASGYARSCIPMKTSYRMMEFGVEETAGAIRRYEENAAQQGITKEDLRNDAEYVALLNEHESRFESCDTQRQAFMSYLLGVEDSFKFLYDYINDKSDDLDGYARSGDAEEQFRIVNTFHDGLWCSVFGATTEEMERFLPKDVIQATNDVWDGTLGAFCDCWRLHEELCCLPDDADATALDELKEKLDQAKTSLHMAARTLDGYVEDARSMLPPEEELQRASEESAVYDLV